MRERVHMASHPERSPAGAGGAVGVVLQATGSHAWSVSGGWGRAAAALGVLGAELAPRARWGARAPDEDGGLADYLAHTRPADLVLLLGFDWHSQALHAGWRWRRRLARARGRKVLYVHESVAAAARVGRGDEMARAFASAAELCDGVLYADRADRPLVEAAGKPARWLPFGVDAERFRPVTPFVERAPRAFFRGKVDAFEDDREYAERRRLLAHLRARGLVEVLPYTAGPVALEALVADFNRFRIAVNLPSVFASHPTRVLEGMACGCCVVTPRTGAAEVDALLREGVEVVYYDGADDLEAAVRRLAAAPAEAGAIAARARVAALERFALPRLLDEVIAWARASFPGVLPRWTAPDTLPAAAAGP